MPPQHTGHRIVPAHGLDRSQLWLNCGDTKSTAQHVAFTARNLADVIAFHAAALAAGARGSGQPGLQLQYHTRYFSTLVLDPDGNTLKVACHGLK